MSRTDSSLLISQFEPFADVVPLNTYYQVEDATSASTNQFTFYITSPGANMLLDPEVLIRAKLNLVQNVAVEELANPMAASRIILREQFASSIQAGIGAANLAKVCPRQGFILARAMLSISLTINGQVITCQPHEFHDALTRLYVSHEESCTLMSTSGGALDTGCGAFISKDMVIDGRSGLVDLRNDETFGQGTFPGFDVAQGARDTTEYSYKCGYENKGLSKRYCDMERYQRGRFTATTDPVHLAAQSYPSDYVRWITEPLPIAPFYSLPSRDSKRSIPHIDAMTISIQFNPKTIESLFQTTVFEFNDVNTTNWTFDMSLIKPQLLLRWYVPPVASPLINKSMPLP